MPDQAWSAPKLLNGVISRLFRCGICPSKFFIVDDYPLTKMVRLQYISHFLVGRNLFTEQSHDDPLTISESARVKL